MDTEKQTPTSSPARALLIVGKKDLEPRPGNYSRPTPIPQAHTVLRPQDSCPGEGGGGDESLRVCPPISVPSAVHRAKSFEISSRPTSMHQQHQQAPHYPRFDFVPRGGSGGEGKPGQQRLPFPTPTYIISPQAMYAHPPDGATLPQCRLTSENTRRPRHLRAAGRRERERRRPPADGQHRQG